MIGTKKGNYEGRSQDRDCEGEKLKFSCGQVGFNPVFVYEIAHFILSNFSNNHLIQLALFASKRSLERSTLNLMKYYFWRVVLEGQGLTFIHI